MKWIKVEDKLPIQMPENWETLDWVLVTTDSPPNPITIARWSDKKWEFFGTDNLFTFGAFSDCTAPILIDDITHWMPLPKPPKD